VHLLRSDRLARIARGQTLEGVLQLADVAGPGVADQRSERRGREPRGRAALARRAADELHGDQLRHVLGSLAQRRDGDPDHVESVEQVGAEAPGADVGVEVALGGRDDARAQAQRIAAPDALELSLLEHAQEPPLQTGVELADLVQEEGSVGGALAATGAPRDGAGEGAALVPEQLALQHRGCERGAVGVHEGSVATR